MPASVFTTNFNFALPSDDDFNWGNDYRNNLDKADAAIKEMQDMAANFISIVKNHLTSTDHNWRYYTKTELSNGSLDTLYYTQTDLDGTILDTRYYEKSQLYIKSEVYTKIEMNSLFALKSDFETGSSLITILDGRYYKKSQIDGGVLDDLFYTKTQTDTAIKAKSDAEKALLDGSAVSNHLTKYQIKATGVVNLFDMRDPNAQRVVSPLEGYNLNISDYATILSTYPFYKKTVSIITRYGYKLNNSLIGFPAGYACEFFKSPGKFKNAQGQDVNSVWIPVSVDEVATSGSDYVRFGGEMIALEGTELNSQYVSSTTTLF